MIRIVYTCTYTPALLLRLCANTKLSFALFIDLSMVS